MVKTLNAPNSVARPWRRRRLALFLVAIGLLAANVYGLTKSLRGPSLHLEEQLEFEDDIKLTESEFYATISDVNPPLGRKAYVVKLTRAVRDCIGHYWDNDGIDIYNLRVPFHENYLLNIASYISPDYFLKFQFTDYRRAVERGDGLCSQHAIITSEILIEKDIPASVVRLAGHVVVQANVGSEGSEEWWILDPDYGVVIPFSLSQIEKSPKVTRRFYEQEGVRDTATLAWLEDTFGAAGNIVLEPVGARAYHRKLYYVERLSYMLIWLIPAFLALPQLATILKR